MQTPKKDWTPIHTNAFQQLKDRLINVPILTNADPTKPYTVTTDASGIALGGVLSQDDKPIAFMSRKLNSAEENYPIHELKHLAIIAAFQDWRHYLEGVPEQTKVITDYQSLIYLTTQSTLSRHQARWQEFLSRFDFKIIYQPGKTNVVADALSRPPQEEINMISHITNNLTKQVKEAYQDDEGAQEIIKYLQDPTKAVPA